LKVENVRDRHRSTGRLFQAHGMATARARSPVVERCMAVGCNLIQYNQCSKRFIENVVKQKAVCTRLEIHLFVVGVWSRC